MSGAPLLQRETFQVSRMMEYFSAHELTKQMGLGPSQWPLALLKEMVNNGLDAGENTGVAPVITVTLQPDALIVQDNGRGLPLETIERSLDYSIRVSDKVGYVSPSRGQQGHALKTLWSAPFVATSTGRVGIETAGQRYEVRVTVNRLTQEPRVTLVCLGDTDVKNGTRITLHWRQIARLSGSRRHPAFLQSDERVRRIQSAHHGYLP